jgi:hypothetical protein
MCLAALMYSMPTYDKLLPLRDCPVRDTPLFCNFNIDPVIQKVVRAVAMSHVWDFSKYWTSAITGIPPHVQTYISLEEIKRKIDERCNGVEVMIDEKCSRIEQRFREELDIRSIGGGELTVDLIRREISSWGQNQNSSIIDEIKAISNRLGNMESSASHNPMSTDEQVNGLRLSGLYKWKDDGVNDEGHLLPEEFRIPKKMTLINLWHKWHHSFEWEDDSRSRKYQIRPLKILKAKDYPWDKRMFARVRKMCKLLDEACGIVATRQNPDISTLNELFHSNQVIASTIHPLSVTNSNRKRTREAEFMWGTVAREYEARNTKRRRAARNRASSPVHQHQEIESDRISEESLVNNTYNVEGDNLVGDSDEEVSVRERECVNMYGADFLKKLISSLT